MKRIITFSALLVFIFMGKVDIAYAQSNIDQSYVKTRWMDGNLKNLTFRNGKMIRVVRDLTEWRRINYSDDVREAAVFIRNTARGEEYYYNYLALIDTGNIIPEGYRMPDITDFKNSKIYFENSSYSNSDTSGLRVKRYGYIIWADPYFQVFDTSENSSHFWIAPSRDNTSEYVATAWIREKNYGVTVGKGNALPTEGYVIRCIEDNVYNAQYASVGLDYKLLMPDQFLAMQKSITNILSKSGSLKQKQFSVYQFDLNFDKNGDNRSQVKPLTDNIRPALLQELRNEVRNSKYKSPVYRGRPIRCHSVFNVDFNVQPSSLPSSFAQNLSLKRLISNGGLNISRHFELSNLLKTCSDRGFKYVNRETEYYISFGSNYVFEQGTTNYLSKIKGRGPIYSLCSVVPGLGLTLLTKGAKETKSMRVFKNTVLGTSVSLGLISVASKIYSEVYYRKFKSNPDGPNSNSNYLNSNISQKVFVSTALAYCALFALDFSFTFNLGCKNKILQTKTNRILRTLNNNELIIK